MYQKVSTDLNFVDREKNIEKFKEYLKKILPRVRNFNEKEIIDWSEISIKARNVASCPYEVTREMEIEMYKSSLM